MIKKSVEFALPVLLTDDTDFKTPKTGVLFGAVTASFAKQGGTSTPKTVTALNWTEIGGGMYLLTFSASDLDTVGFFLYTITVSAALPYYGAEQISENLVDDLNTLIGEVKSQTDLIPADPATETSLDLMDDKLDDIKGKTELIPLNPATQEHVQEVEDKVDIVIVDIAAIDTKVDSIIVTLDGVDGKMDTTLENLAIMQATIDEILVIVEALVPAPPVPVPPVAPTTASDIFDLIAPQYALSASKAGFLLLSRARTNPFYYGANFEYAVALLAAHAHSLTSTRSGGETGSVSSKSEGDLSVSYSSNSSSAITSLDQTHYGQQLRSLRSEQGVFVGVTGGNDVGHV